MAFKVPEEFRVSNNSFEFKKDSITYFCSVEDSDSWEHVAVTIHLPRAPTWQEMTVAKNTFWDAGDVVMQFHPAHEEYINNHVFCLHLFRPIGIYFPAPPAIIEGLKS